MNILAIDYGDKKIGLALADGILAEPYTVITYTDTKKLLFRLGEIIYKKAIDLVLIGISEGRSKKRAINFENKLKNYLGNFSKSVLVKTVDETLSTKEAVGRAIEAGIQRKKRKAREDAYAAAVILQNYLDCK